MLTSACAGTLCVVLLLPLTAGLFKREVLEQRGGAVAEMTPLCTNDTLITAIVCKIHRSLRSGEQCRLRYFHDYDLVNECGSGIRLTPLNHAIFLQLSDLSPADSGSYDCECTKIDGIFTLHLNITVEEHTVNTVNKDLPFPRKWIIFGVSILFLATITGVILAFICKRRHPRQQSGAATQLHMEKEEKAMYATLQEPSRDIYQTVINVDT